MEKDKEGILEENQRELDMIQKEFEDKQKSLEKQKEAIVSGNDYVLSMCVCYATGEIQVDFL